MTEYVVVAGPITWPEVGLAAVTFLGLALVLWVLSKGD